MRRFLLILFTCTTLGLTYGHASASPPFTVGLVTSAAGLGDRGFTDQAYTALRISQRRFPFNLIVQEANQAGTISEEDMTTLIARSDILFLLGTQYHTLLEKYAQRFPEKYFVLIGRKSFKTPNTYSIHYRTDEGAFLAGILAAHTTRTNVIAFLGGTDTPEILAAQLGFAAGAHSINEDIVILNRMVGDHTDYTGFKNPRKAEQIALQLYDSNADILLTMSGLSDMGALQACRKRPEANIIIAGEKIDTQLYKQLLATIERNVLTQVNDALTAFREGRLLTGHRELGLAEYGIQLLPTQAARAKLPEQVLQELDQAEQDIVNITVNILKSEQTISVRQAH